MTIKRNSVLLALALTIGGCGGTQNRGLDSVHQPVVSRTDYVYDIGSSGGGISGDEVRRLSGWLQSLKVGYGDKISVDAPESYGDNAGRDAIAALAARYGLLLEQTAPFTAGEIAPGSMRVIVSRMKAEVPNCPDWSRKSQPEFGANTTSNFGCANNSNLAAMIANPEDLITGHVGDTVSSAATASKAITTYRELPATGRLPLKKEVK
jgi:pilus assembly protein CpaD